MIALKFQLLISVAASIKCISWNFLIDDLQFRELYIISQWNWKKFERRLVWTKPFETLVSIAAQVDLNPESENCDQ